MPKGLSTIKLSRSLFEGSSVDPLRMRSPCNKKPRPFVEAVAVRSGSLDFAGGLSPILAVMALAEDMPAGTVLLALNPHPLSGSEIAITARASFTAPDVGLLSFKSPKFSWCQVTAAIAVPDSLLLSPLFGFVLAAVLLRVPAPV